MPDPTTLKALWQTITMRCHISPATAMPPFVVELYEGGELLSRSLFPEHDQACAHAIDALRVALPTNK